VVGEVPGVREMLGMVLVSIGILFLGVLGLSRSRQEIASSAFALAMGALIAGHTVSDGAGVRLSSDAFAYIAWLFVLELPPPASRPGMIAGRLSGQDLSVTLLE
jgi:drug/metabolite transporter (DMT)-like permease